ncbi:P-loop containing nucleoside triphosphate hydrolase protein [Mycena sp. CBHHK59/15]|nr:P-loop containing nucleoside triphosphate hydrolase protein [Mycena sp. CBHHK59/15]
MTTDTLDSVLDDRDDWTIALIGTPGVGKSRFISRCVLDDFQVRDIESLTNSLILTLVQDLDGSNQQGFSRQITVDERKTIVTLTEVPQPQQNHRSTIIQRGKTTTMQITSSGQDALCMNRSSNQADLVCSEADAFILMYSTTSPYSLQDVVAYTRAVRRVKGTSTRNPVITLVAHQSDRAAQDQEVSRAEGLALARELDCPFTEASAKTARV